MPADFLIFLLYLFYGMAFFAIGVSITSRDTRSSHLKIAGILWLFALFAYSHAFHEWFELYQNLPFLTFPERYAPLIYSLKLLLVLVSFVFLLIFGVRVLRLAFPDQRKVFNLLPIPFAVMLLLIVISHLSELRPEDYTYIDHYSFINARVRNLIGLPGAFFSGIGLLYYSRTLTNISGKGSRNFAGAGYALMLYGILTGVIPSGSHLPLLNLPIELFRSISAFVILHFVMHALYIFDEERRLLIEERLARFAKAEKLHALGKLAFGIAHEINNPLTNVSMTVELLQNEIAETQDSERTKKRFVTIERNLDRASKIARELLAFSPEKETQFAPTAINEVIESTLALLGARCKDYRIECDFSSLDDISGIPWKLEEVFLNVLVNAMDASQEGERILIRTRQGNHQVIVEICDRGCGIPEDQLGLVLDPFFTTKPVGKGTGLGLSICYGIMDLHGGQIDLSSEVDKGTKVRLIFPQEEAENGKNIGR